jgi:ATP-dependent Clp protease ATP-binding subunit ClpX
LGKKLDFAAYGIEIKFEDPVLQMLAQQAAAENTGARGLVSAVEKTFIEFEKQLPSTPIKKFPATTDLIKDPEKSVQELAAAPNDDKTADVFEKLAQDERNWIIQYLKLNKKHLSAKYNFTMTASRMNIVAQFYAKNVMDIENVVKHIKSSYDDIKKIELYFFKNHDINIVLEEDAIDFIMEQLIATPIHLDDIFKKVNMDFEHCLKLAREKTGHSRYFINRQALLDPEAYVRRLIQNEMGADSTQDPK